VPSEPTIDGVLIKWGERLFYPGNRIVTTQPLPKLSASAAHRRADAIRLRIEATVVGRAPQVMVKVTGGGRGMRAIAAHFRYISRNGRLTIEDERGETLRGKDVLPELADDWRFGGTLIDDAGDRREAFNIMLSMPHGIDPLIVQKAAREFAREELAGHKYLMVLHDHQANPHVHISVRAESKRGTRLNPRKSDLHRWRETFAERLRGYGVEAEATRQATRGRTRNFDPIWRLKAGEEGRLRTKLPATKGSANAMSTRVAAVDAWQRIAQALATSGDRSDRDLANAVARYAAEISAVTSADRSGGLRALQESTKRIDVEHRR